ncbi:MAG TPA: 50S ribosomal protein L28 [Firmicutes bacterium]|nr:50S ribosomal protein L28 [Bacillota bacterium]
MSRRCDICQKGAKTGFQISHSHIRSKRQWNANIQKVKAIVNGQAKRIKVCSRCLRSGKVQRAL